MEPQNPVSFIAQIASSGIGLTGLANSRGVMETSWSVQGEGSPPIGLNLELGRGSDQNTDGAKRRRGFTILQLQELQLQALIYKYMEAGLPVPCNLLLPIWQSFSSNGLLPHYPSSLGFTPVCLDSRKGMEPEPWRCRRTDGKKWRCSKEALPQQKYCERHINRGRHRSRKLIDASQYNPNYGCNSTASKTPKATKNGRLIGSNMTDLSISLPVNSTSSSLFPRLALFNPEDYSS